jgi:wyosine [tRNA(Phe)-imidazoG37] synthetase (radical SAM superfamily)
MTSQSNSEPSRVVTDHRRQWRDCLYVYPVISRRSAGVSIGVNLNIDKRCTFSCVYCQINRRQPRPTTDVDPARLRKELDEALQAVVRGDLWREERFAQTPPELRRINDIAFSGDGEPTCLPNFDQAVKVAVDALRSGDLIGRVKLVVITNSSFLRQPQVTRALPLLDAAGGEFWMKLDAGTEVFFKKVNRPVADLTLDTICENILSVAKDRPVVIQTLPFRYEKQPPSENEILAYCQRLRNILKEGGQIRLVQVHTVARNPAEPFVSYLPEDDLRALADRIAKELPQLIIEVYPGVDVPPQNRQDI